MIDTVEQIGIGSSNRLRDRPAWIPAEIESNWDSDPYAYQTEEELMPQGPRHSIINRLIAEVLIPHIEKLGITLWMDLFLLYRNDQTDKKKRIAPDCLLAPVDLKLVNKSWDLDDMPVPKLVVEITSPKSRKADFGSNRELYTELGVETYLLIDGFDEQGNETEQIRVHVWRNGVEIDPNAEQMLDIPELHIEIKAESEQLVFIDRQTHTALLRQNEKDQLIQQLLQKLKEVEENSGDAT